MMETRMPDERRDARVVRAWSFFSRSLEVATVLCSLTAVATLAWYHGYAQHTAESPVHVAYLHGSLAFYMFAFSARASPCQSLAGYLRAQAREALVLGLVLLTGITNFVTDYAIADTLFSFTGATPEHNWVLFLHLCLLVLAGMALARLASRGVTRFRVPAGWLFVISFAVLILVGSALLMLPRMSNVPNRLSYIDALFTSTSAVCVTGLTVVDTASQFSTRGHVLLLMLIQAGGLNIIFFATFYLTRHTHAGASTRDAVAAELLHTRTLSVKGASRLLGRVVATALIIEGAGAVVLWLLAPPAENPVLVAIFHSVSAFNNAGFSVYPGGLENQVVVDRGFLHFAMAALIVLGGLGFTTIWQIVSGHKLNAGAKISVIGAAFLTLFGALVLRMAEAGIPDGGRAMSWGGAFFHSVTARTAGFSTMNIGEFEPASLMALMVLMFIGASSGSTGGGIKTSTVAALSSGAASNVGWRPKSGLISSRVRQKARLIVAGSSATVALGTLALWIAEAGRVSLLESAFEEVSAFATVGLSTGMTSSLSVAGKIIVLCTMFIGRIGPLALAYMVFADPHESSDCRELMVG